MFSMSHGMQTVSYTHLDVYKRRDLCYDCMTYAHDFHKGYSCFTYGLHERELLFDFKYNNRRYLAGKFGDILYDRISCENIHPDVIIPVPVSRSRMKKRGYNQSALLAKRLSERWGVLADDGILIRKKDTPPLRGLTPAEREAKLADAFAVADGKTSKIAGKRVLLIDDIYTVSYTHLDVYKRQNCIHGEADCIY